MAITAVYESSQALTDTTEWSCTTDTAGPDVDTSDGVFQVFLDVSDMTLGDVLQIRVYEKVQAGSTQRIALEAILRDTQSTPVWVGPSLILMNGWDITVTALTGTITVEWSVRKVS